MEDRHYLSEPRPISGLKLPTWEVDVMRDGVDMPILTLQVDNQILPPRKRKKKVVWKLPDSLETTPKFGMEDKRRILELFKQKKKELKRQRKSQTQTSSGASPPSSSSSQPKVLKRMSSSTISLETYKDSPEEEEKVECPEPGEEKVEDVQTQTPPGFHMSGLSLEDSNNTATITNNDPTPPTPPEPMQPLQERSHSFAGSRGPPMMASSSSATPPPPGMNSRRASTSNIPPPGMNPFQTMARQFIVADPNALGHVVMETYYLLLRNGMIQDLAQYYLPDAQKSLTVGGAHALVTHVDQRLLQLESLTNMVLQVKGVLQHPRLTPEDNIYVMITGTSVRPHTLPFCHSLVLKQVGPQSFQIQNDALAFLTTEG